MRWHSLGMTACWLPGLGCRGERPRSAKNLIGAGQLRDGGEIRSDHQGHDGYIFSEGFRRDAAKRGKVLRCELLWQLRQEIAFPSRLEDPNTIPGLQPIVLCHFLE